MFESPVLDVEGKPLRSGVEYYILPAETYIAGGLTTIYTVIIESRDFTVAFSGATTCADSSAWKNEQGLYTLAWRKNCIIPFPGADCCPSSRRVSAGIVKENGKRLLVLDGPAFPFAFRRAKVILPASTKNN
ncbi:unnamed protein product [Dovyalis caffra]|uniref:Uncharacterized protein n=1 Tax=Dovyalis caffra TaxID=77055 RepID=A0AAV1SQD0_9ROSI|nr:unnamed protein product [Dovyalis caffra]